MRWCLTLFATLLAVSLSAPQAGATDIKLRKLKVYSRNVYLGADLNPVLAAQTPEQFIEAANNALTDVALNAFPVRAQALVAEIARFRPQLIGLQEVFNYTVNGANLPAPSPFQDYLALIEDELAAAGLDYQVVGTVVNLNLALPLDVTGDGQPELVGVTDRDVILARGDVPATAVQLCATPSADGCNYSVNLPLDLPDPLPDSFVFRGYVAVDADLNGATVRFVNTHLEVQGPLNGFDISGVQAAQAQELLAVLEAQTPKKRPIILVGDINSAPNDAFPAPYAQISGATYRDTWDTNLLRFLNPDGFTCCQDSDLDNALSVLDERIDVVFVRNHFGFLPFSVL